MIGGTISWISFFTIGMLFPFIVVSVHNTFSQLHHLPFNLLSGSIELLFLTQQHLNIGCTLPLKRV